MLLKAILNSLGALIWNLVLLGAGDKLDAFLAGLNDSPDLDKDEIAMLPVGAQIGNLAVRNMAAVLITVGLAVAIIDVVPPAVLEAGLSGNGDFNLLEECLLMADFHLIFAPIGTLNVKGDFIANELK